MRQAVVNLIRGAIVKNGVATLVVVKADLFGKPLPQLGSAAEGIQVKVVIF
jgi:hypothetical protein